MWGNSQRMGKVPSGRERGQSACSRSPLDPARVFPGAGEHVRLHLANLLTIEVVRERRHPQRAALPTPHDVRERLVGGLARAPQIGTRPEPTAFSP